MSQIPVIILSLTVNNLAPEPVEISSLGKGIPLALAETEGSSAPQQLKRISTYAFLAPAKFSRGLFYPGALDHCTDEQPHNTKPNTDMIGHCTRGRERSS